MNTSRFYSWCMWGYILAIGLAVIALVINAIHETTLLGKVEYAIPFFCLILAGVIGALVSWLLSIFYR